MNAKSQGNNSICSHSSGNVALRELQMSYSVQSLLLEDYELWPLDGSENNNIMT